MLLVHFIFIAMCCGQMNKKWELIVLAGNCFFINGCLENLNDGLRHADFLIATHTHIHCQIYVRTVVARANITINWREMCETHHFAFILSPPSSSLIRFKFLCVCGFFLTPLSTFHISFVFHSSSSKAKKKRFYRNFMRNEKSFELRLQKSMSTECFFYDNFLLFWMRSSAN